MGAGSMKSQHCNTGNYIKDDNLFFRQDNDTIQPRLQRNFDALIVQAEHFNTSNVIDNHID
jgi:hypothetical protein